MRNKQFQPHIAGLRGLAILGVVLFHFTQSKYLELFKCFSYGYLGVDIFFVLMGYFMFKGFCSSDTIPASDYARKKLLRLLPALVATILITFSLAFFFVDNKDLYNASVVGWTALFGWSNVCLKEITTGYFSTDASYNPLLHTWYLSVTLQLLLAGYILYRGLKFLRKSLILSLLIIVGIISFCVAHINGILNICPSLRELISPNSPYYDTFPRVWELLAGGAILLLPDISYSRFRHILAGVGLAAIVWPILLSGRELFFIDIPVVVGTMLVARYTSGTILMPLLSNPFTLFLGKISYSWYLVHMPILVLYKLWIFDDPSDEAIGILLLVSVIAGYGMWWLVEKRRCLWHILLSGWVIAFSLCLYGKYSDGFSRFVNSGIETIDIKPHHTYVWQQETDKSYAKGLDCTIIEPAFISQNVNPNEIPPLKRIGAPSVPPTFVLIGDSHIYHLGIALEHICRKEHTAGIMLDSIIIPFCNRSVTRQAGTPFYNYNREKFHALFSWLESHPEFKTIIIGQHWYRFEQLSTDWDGKTFEDDSADELMDFFTRLKELGRNVIVIEPTPVYQNPKIDEYLRVAQRRKKFSTTTPEVFVCTLDEHDGVYRQAKKLLPELEKRGLAQLVRVQQLFFSEGESSNIQEDYVICCDTNHLTIPAAQKMGDFIAPQVLPYIK